MSRILVVEDEQHIADGLRFNLEAEGHDVTIAADGERALASILDDRSSYDVVVLDVMLPGRDGFEVASTLRTAGQFVPILMLTARGRPEDVLRGFAAGADDYLPKPFELAILIARINGLLRRRLWNERKTSGRPLPPTPTRSPDGRLDFTAMEIHAARHVIPADADGVLSSFDIWWRMPGQPVSRGTLLENVWGCTRRPTQRAIDNFIVRLRRYCEDRPKSPLSADGPRRRLQVRPGGK
jgi:DNA-binding response OmpR family regulator